MNVTSYQLISIHCHLACYILQFENSMKKEKSFSAAQFLLSPIPQLYTRSLLCPLLHRLLSLTRA